MLKLQIITDILKTPCWIQTVKFGFYSKISLRRSVLDWFDLNLIIVCSTFTGCVFWHVWTCVRKRKEEEALRFADFSNRSDTPTHTPALIPVSHLSSSEWREEDWAEISFGMCDHGGGGRRLDVFSLSQKGLCWQSWPPVLMFVCVCVFS